MGHWSCRREKKTKNKQDKNKRKNINTVNPSTTACSCRFETASVSTGRFISIIFTSKWSMPASKQKCLLQIVAVRTFSTVQPPAIGLGSVKTTQFWWSWWGHSDCCSWQHRDTRSPPGSCTCQLQHGKPDELFSDLKALVECKHTQNNLS